MVSYDLCSANEGKASMALLPGLTILIAACQVQCKYISLSTLKDEFVEEPSHVVTKRGYLDMGIEE